MNPCQSKRLRVSLEGQDVQEVKEEIKVRKSKVPLDIRIEFSRMKKQRLEQSDGSAWREDLEKQNNPGTTDHLEAQPHFHSMKIKDQPRLFKSSGLKKSFIIDYHSQPKVQQKGKLITNDSDSTGEVINRGQKSSRTHSKQTLITSNTLKKIEVKVGALGARPEVADISTHQLKDLGSARKPKSKK